MFSSGNSRLFPPSKTVFPEFETKILSVFIKLRLNFIFFLLFLHHRCPQKSLDVLERFGFIRIMKRMIRIHSHARVFLSGSENHGISCSRISARQMVNASPGLREKRPFIRKITTAAQTAKQLLFCGENTVRRHRRFP